MHSLARSAPKETSFLEATNNMIAQEREKPSMVEALTAMSLA